MPHSRGPLLVAALVAGVIPAFRAPAHAAASDPVPVLPGSTILSPGPRALGFAGLRADPSTIGNFRGLVALAYLRGRVRDATGRRWVMENDIRLLQGDYVSADGIERQGTFAFV
jgi:hypothetical protein